MRARPGRDSQWALSGTARPAGGAVSARAQPFTPGRFRRPLWAPPLRAGAGLGVRFPGGPAHERRPSPFRWGGPRTWKPSLEVHRVLEALESLLEEALLALLVLQVLDLGELAQEVFLPRRQRAWSHHFDGDQLVAARRAMHHRHALALQAHRCAALRAGRNLQRLLAVERQHLDLRAQRAVSEADRQLVQDVGALPLKILVRLDGERHEEVARRAAARPSLALTRDTHVDAVVHAGGDVDRHTAHIAHAALALAGLAWCGDDAPLAATAIADHHIDALAEDGLLHAANLAGALAGAAALRAGAWLRAGAPAGLARLPARNLDLFLAAAHGVFEGDGQLIAQVCATLRSAAPRARRAGGRGLKDRLENIAEAAEAEASERSAARGAAIDGGMAEAVVGLALLGIAEHLVPFVDLLEAFLGALLLVDIRMILARQLAKRLLDLFLVGVTCHTQNLVIVAFRCGHRHPLYPAPLHSSRARASAHRTV